MVDVLLRAPALVAKQMTVIRPPKTVTLSASVPAREPFQQLAIRSGEVTERDFL